MHPKLHSLTNRPAFALAIAAAVLVAPAARSEKISLVGGTVINPRDGRIIPNAVVVINGETIESVAPASEAKRGETPPPWTARASSSCPVTSTRMCISSNPAAYSRDRTRWI
ncbi:MAG: hypothetical protein H0W20_01300 [Chthoniobacterales bacterium]|nr:hypothetical protein [Chthoniobacterales bacterium]